MNTNTILTDLEDLQTQLSKRHDISPTDLARDIYYGILQTIESELSESISTSYRPIINVYTEYKTKLPSSDVVFNSVKSDPTLLDDIYTTLLSGSEYLNKSGQFFTPLYLSNFMASIPEIKKTNSVLDPACGPGVFLQSIHATKSTVSTTGIDKDALVVYAAEVRSHLTGNNTQFVVEDFLTKEFEQKFDVIIGNPPYNKFQNCESTSTDINEIGSEYNISRLSNLYALFFLKSAKLVEENGYIVFLTPSEYLQTEYGNTLKRLFKEKFRIEKFIKLDWDENIFDAVTTLCITVLQKKSDTDSNTVDFYVSDEPDSLESTLENTPRSICQNKLDHTEKWTKYFKEITYTQYLDSTVPLDTFAETKRGISTGYNEYFTFTDSELTDKEIEQKYIKPVLTKTKQAKNYTFTSADFESLCETETPVHLLYYQGEPVSDSLQEYIEYGEKIDADERYITSHRNPWYSMEHRDPPEILATVFSRDDMRFIYNKKEVVTLAAFHGIYPHNEDETWIKAFLAYLNSDIALDLAKTQYREYGDGLNKLEPGDLSDLPVLDFSKLTPEQLSRLSELFEQLDTARREGKEQDVKQTLNNTIIDIFENQAI